MKRGELGGELIGPATCVVGAILSGNRILVLVGEPAIKERACSADVGVPVGHRAKLRPGVQVHAGQTAGGRNQRAGPFSIGAEIFPIFIKLRVKTARAPTAKDLLHPSGVYS
jgi:hypothetical protein